MGCALIGAATLGGFDVSGFGYAVWFDTGLLFDVSEGDLVFWGE